MIEAHGGVNATSLTADTSKVAFLLERFSSAQRIGPIRSEWYGTSHEDSEDRLTGVSVA